MSKKAGIYGIGAALPPDIVTNFDLEQTLDTTDAWITKRTGIKQRHRINGQQTLADLAIDACQMALKDAGRDGAEVDRTLVCTLTPDRIMPGLAPAVSKGIGAGTSGAIDMNAACSGFLYALDHAAALVESGRAELIVVCGAEALSRITDQTDRGTAILFADGAGAAVVAAGDLEVGCSSFELGCDGQYAELLYCNQDERMLRMAGREVYRHAVAAMVECSEKALAKDGLTVDDVDLFVAHQANARIIEAAARRLGLPEEKLAMNVDRVANTSSASIPLALHQAEQEGKLKPGMTVVMTSFGAGFTWGAGVVKWKERAHVTA